MTGHPPAKPPIAPRPGGWGRQHRQVAIHLRAEQCKGCAYCVAICPRQVYAMLPAYNRKGHHYPEIVRLEACIGCLRCETICPDLALWVESI